VRVEAALPAREGDARLDQRNLLPQRRLGQDRRRRPQRRWRQSPGWDGAAAARRACGELKRVRGVVLPALQSCPLPPALGLLLLERLLVRDPLPPLVRGEARRDDVLELALQKGHLPDESLERLLDRRVLARRAGPAPLLHQRGEEGRDLAVLSNRRVAGGLTDRGQLTLASATAWRALIREDVDRVGRCDSLDRVGRCDSLDRGGRCDSLDRVGRCDSLDRGGRCDSLDCCLIKRHCILVQGVLVCAHNDDPSRKENLRAGRRRRREAGRGGEQRCSDHHLGGEDDPPVQKKYPYL